MGGGGGKEADRLPPGRVGMGGESCKDCSVMHAGIAGIIETGQGWVPMIYISQITRLI